MIAHDIPLYLGIPLVGLLIAMTIGFVVVLYIFVREFNG